MATRVERQQCIAEIRYLPSLLAASVNDLIDAQLDQRSDVDPWTIRQIVHHLSDSHLNAFIRMKLMLTEDRPTLKPYNQDAWAALPDTTSAPIQAALAILEGLHVRWAVLLEHLGDDAWNRSGFHPENGVITLDDMLESYASHGAEHIAQIKRIRAAQGW